MRSLVLFAVGVASLAASRTASASDCSPAWTTGPVVAADAGVTLESLDSQLECSGPRRRWTCRLRETYVVRGGSTAGTPAAVYFDPRVRAEIRIDGAYPVVIDPPTFDGEVLQMLEAIRSEGDQTIAFRIPTAPEVTRRIVIETRTRHDPECSEPVPIERRHPLVSRDLATEIDLHAWGGLGAEQSPEYTETHRVRLPVHWLLDRRAGLRRDREAGRGHFTANPYSRYRIERRPPVGWGGPIVAVGVARRTGSVEPRLRAGWEIGVLRRVLVSVAAESDARRHLEIVPAIEATFSRRLPRHMWYLPLPSVGIGAPVQVVPTTRGGVRGLVGLHWPYVGIVGFFDGYPPIGSQRRIVTGGAMLQLGI